MLDILFIGMFAIAFTLAFSIYLVRVKKNYLAHKRIQISLAIFLLMVLVGFEIDIRFFSDWRKLAEHSPYFESGFVYKSLFFHLMFAIPTPFLWGFVIWHGLKKFPSAPKPGPHSARHRFWGRIAAGFMFTTAVTGSLFYWLAFWA